MKCRLCLTECIGANGTPLFNNGEESNLTKMIAKYLFIEVTQLDVFSTIMCNDCLQHINAFHKFFQHIQQQQQILQNEFLEIKCIAGEETSNITTDLDDKQMDLEHNDESMLDIKDVIIEEDTCLVRSTAINEFGYADAHFDAQVDTKNSESEEDVPLNLLFDKVKKSVKTTSLKLSFTNSNSDGTKAKRQYTKTKCKAVKNKHGGDTSASQEGERNNYLDGKTTKRQYAKSKCKAVENQHEGDTNASQEEERNNYLTPEENKLRDEKIAEYIPMKCEICSVHVETYNDLQTHFRKEHKKRVFITCCGTRYLRRSLLLDHIQSHLNPNHFRCEFCQKVLKSRTSLKLHMANMHIDRNNMKHTCQICNKKFPFLSVLNSHMIAHQNQTDHACVACGKGFKTEYMLKLHIQRIHDKKAPFMCETCGKEYRFKLSFERHIAEHQGRLNEPTEQCSICGQWLRYNCLRKHMQRHENQTFECTICDKICKSKSALTSHIDYCHKMKLVHSCSLCEKSFKRKIRLQEHMALHTGHKDYNCPHCPREFRSKANMYVHIKKIHVEEWTKAQIARNQGPTGHKEKLQES